MKLFEDLSTLARLAIPWRGKQSNARDEATDLMYRSGSLDELRRALDERGLDTETGEYALVRWRNLRRHDAWLSLFLSYDNIDAAPARDPLRDFFIKDEMGSLAFDLKVTRIPRSMPGETDKQSIAEWMYRNQSKERRFHTQNRLFVVAKDEANLYDYSMATTAVKTFMESFPSTLFTVKLDMGQEPKTGVITPDW